MKKSELKFNLISIPVDFLMILAAGTAAFYLRFKLEGIRPIIFNLSYADYLAFLFLIAPIIILFIAFSGSYNLRVTRRFKNEMVRIFLAVSSGLLIVVVLFFFNQTVFPSRLIILMSWLLAIVFVCTGRLLLLGLQRRMLKRGIGSHRLVVIDQDSKHRKLMDEINKRPETGYKMVSSIVFSQGQNLDGLISQLEDIRQKHGIDELLQADPNLPADVNERILSFCRDYNILFNFIPDVFKTPHSNVTMDRILGVPVLVLKSTPLEGWGRIIKRVMDVVLSLIGLILASPIFLLTAVAIKLSSKGPVFFHQPRAAGLGSFECYKFRSMHYEMSEGTKSGDKLREQLEKQNSRVGPYVKIKNDPRVTPVGRFIRRTKIDELPQLWHILRGQMSLVGPRVHMVKEVDKFRNDYKKLFVLKPGATGLTQITQASEKPEISWEEEIKLDQYYIENWSLSLDFFIIFKTVLILLGKKPKVDY
jgi:exopolysaccharide biosynthesis polyprenyl glycosylphosphotransferase